VEWAVSSVLPVHSAEEVRGSTSVETPYFAQTNEPTNGCHVETHDWAMWHHVIHPNRCHLSTTDWSNCLSSCQLRTATSLPCQHATVSATSACATCHPYPGDMCHPLTGTNPCRTPPHLPRVITRSCHISCMTYTVILPRGTVRTVQSPIFFFACLGFRTECDIFRIRCPFDEVNIWPESGRRDGCNGIGFV
jgi:hypothetical protein